MRIPPYVAAIRKRTIYGALLFAVLFSCIAIIQYAFVRHEVYQTISRELHESADKIAEQVAPNGKWKIQDYRKDASIPVTSWYIKIGESKNIEFKRSFSPNNAGGNENTESPELGILKTIGAFLNSNGGSLYIGVNDDRTVQGIDADLHQSSIDVFAQKISNLIANRIGTEFSPFIKHRIAKMGEKTVYILDVLMSPRPAFVKSNNKARFYIREGVITKDLDNEQMYRYTLAKRR